MGGVRVDADTQMSNVPGLFAAGEVAAGLHGANRLGGNSLSDLLVFGKLAGEHAARFAREHGAGTLDAGQIDAAAREALAPMERQSGQGEGPYQIQFALQDLLQEKASIIRTDEGLGEAIRDIEDLKRRAEGITVNGSREYNPAWHTALDVPHLLTVGEACARAALARTESRGAHTRVDFPDKDGEWGRKNVVVRKGASGEMDVQTVPCQEIPAELRQIIEEQG
jgi:succinate dehydrogenase / fumarate reductase flavoprotein subunit